ncbi:MAG: hypothetical protein NVS3B7_10330 [Candidatus Elarobacter sp.]
MLDLRRDALVIRGQRFAAVCGAACLLNGGPALAADHVPTNEAVLSDAVFAHAAGIILINESAGVGNAQSNRVLVTFGTASDAGLASVTASRHASSDGDRSNSRNRIVVSDGAFAHATGIVQINQTAGEMNVTSNSLAIHISP